MEPPHNVWYDERRNSFFLLPAYQCAFAGIETLMTVLAIEFMRDCPVTCNSWLAGKTMLLMIENQHVNPVTSE